MKPTQRPAPANRALAAPGRPEHPLLSLQREVNRLFEGFFRGFDPFGPLAPGGSDRPSSALAAFGGGFLPRVNVVENAKEVRVTVELPGMDGKDVDVSISRGALTLRGEKKVESEDAGGNGYRYERSHGAFHRTIPLPAEVTAEKAAAEFRKGILTVRLPKSADARKGARKIVVKPE
jgi:HSP20 family protein